MKKYTSKEVRQMWIKFFESKNHEVIESKSLVPVNDPSLLWINSGVATLKDFFSGKKLPNNPRMTNSQKAIRTNDIENVGVTARHHTFFEMLGNFSIGDYFKTDAIKFAYELLFDVFEFELDKIYITYFEEDLDTYNEWIKVGIDPTHLIKGDKDMNFWDIGQGPSGPDTEIFYDRGERYDLNKVGIELLEKDIENDRYVEIWNIVFSQFNNDGEGNYTDLAQKNIDTGAGLERIVSIFQDAPTNFDTDLFLPIIEDIQGRSKFEYKTENYFNPTEEQTAINKKFRIIADHMRAVVMAIQDGAKPSNTQRGYIIRRLIRRAYRAGIQLGIEDETFLYKLTNNISHVLDVYEVDVNKVNEIIIKEELAFSRTIKQGEEILKKELAKGEKELDAEVAFRLFETFGFPMELTQEIVEDKGIKLDTTKFAALQAKHADASRGKKVSGMDSQITIIQKIEGEVSEFVGYEVNESTSEILFQGEENGKNYVLLDKTPFYATKGGQHFDKGTLNGVQVLDVFRDKYENHWHVTEESISGTVEAKVNNDIRALKESNHTATHLLGLALSKVFGVGAKQLGSDNNEHRLRLDFPLDKKPTPEQLKEVEKEVQKQIDLSIDRKYELMDYDEAISQGTLALEGEDYGEGKLRVVTFGESKEFCGGTHISNTSRIENFMITKLETKGSGVFRIEAVTTNKTIEKYTEEITKSITKEINNIIVKIQKDQKDYSIEFKDTISGLKEQFELVKADAKRIAKEAKKNISVDTDVEFTTYKGTKAYINLDIENGGLVKPTAIALREAHPDAIIIVGNVNGDKQTLAVSSIDHDSKKVFDEIASNHNGRGGGSFDMAMGSMDIVGELDA